VTSRGSGSGPKTKGSHGPTNAQRRLAAERATAARQRVAAAERRRRLFVVAGSVLAVIAVLAVLIIVKLATGAGQPKSGAKASAAPASLMTKVSGVPTATLDAVGTGRSTTAPSAISAPPLTVDGKPEVLYVGAEYCPYCAAERWAVAVALSRFGTLHGVGLTTSSPSDVYPSTATLSFHGASLTSDSVAFTAKELQSNQVVNGQYATLDTLSRAEEAVADKYNAPPYVEHAGSIPFLDLGGRYVISGASYSPQVLHGKSYQQIADALADPSSPIARAVDGTANLITAAICASADQRPASVCSSTGVTAAAVKLDTSR
jgi:hypothetical protein